MTARDPARRRVHPQRLCRLPTLVVMAERPEPVDNGSSAAHLLALAVQLKQAAVSAGRLDVAAKADEVIALLPIAEDPIDGTEQPQERSDAGNTVLKILDGLGF